MRSLSGELLSTPEGSQRLEPAGDSVFAPWNAGENTIRTTAADLAKSQPQPVFILMQKRRQLDRENNRLLAATVLLILLFCFVSKKKKKRMEIPGAEVRS